ncbi:sulfatase-like hydrolase/transferase [Aestuariibacter halophilus]|uniref:Sulfatase-like hydrolase/transferase n=1 Tax=Fluctibacter halophilus TaxID=226011 RepID=A0ABS8G9C0_9ALTE|nr:sulfatase-like hydrolase/transferase [Aestuariibacter halophilus]MCC2616410.1 sulfatase-like hydrolase/transferase [Aestuariibacter halophilus]
MFSTTLSQSSSLIRCHFPGRHTYRLAVATWITAVLNIPLFQSLDSSLVVQVGVLLWLLNGLIVYLFTPGKLLVPGTVVLLLTSSCASYFIYHYGTVIDRPMIQNVMETDMHEAMDLISWPMLMSVLAGALPLVLVGKICQGNRPAPQRIKFYALYLLIFGLGITSLALGNFQQYSGYFRQHKQLKHLATPVNIITAGESYLRNNVLRQEMAFQTIATTVDVAPTTHQPSIVVVVLGETARADHFRANGYGRDTTPTLASDRLINFNDVSSCGTATAHSLPCMFSWLDQAHYEEATARASENVLDVLQRGGIKVQWFDNNSGCKHVCDRIDSVMYWQQPECEDGCTDNVLLDGLRDFTRRVQREGGQGVVVLHQQGSHGPAYFKRSRVENKRFLPECRSETFSGCSTEEIVNAYDNSLVETGALLSGVTRYLEGLKTDAAMLYVSDHGESLGEGGVYLHGLPYWMAPQAQTHVPMMLWLSDGFAQSHSLDTDCISTLASKPQSHDLLFDSLLTLSDVTITTEQPVAGGLSQCRNSQPHRS